MLIKASTPEFCQIKLTELKNYWNDRAEGYSLSVKDKYFTP